MRSINLLVTGGSGFIGSHFIEYMLSKYEEYCIVNLDSLTYAGNNKNLIGISSNKHYSFIYGSINDKDLIRETMSKYKITHMINFAAETHVDRSIINPSTFIETNILGVQTLLDIANEFSIDLFLQISTDEVYGSLGDNGLFCENSPLQPNNPYAASKASGDLLTLAYSKTYGTPIIITRSSNNFGPKQYPEKLIPLMIHNGVSNIELPIYGNGKNIRDWLFVKDNCRAIDLIIHQGAIGEVYNIGANNEKTTIEIVDIIISKLGISPSLKRNVTDRLGHDYRYALDSNKLRKQLGWFPVYSFEKGISDTIDWYLKNSSFFENSIL